MTIKPPAHLLPYIATLGEDLAIEFLLTFGGAELHLGANPAVEGRVADLVGIDLARQLAAAHLPRRVPVGKQWIAQVWRERGLPVAEIARRLHMTDVAVRRWLGKVPTDGGRSAADDRQLPLF